MHVPVFATGPMASFPSVPNQEVSMMLTRRLVVAEFGADPKNLARAMQELAEENINVEGFSVQGGRVYFLVDYPQKALEVLVDLAVAARLEEVLQFEIMNEPGELARITENLATAGVRVRAMFGVTGTELRGPMFLDVDDIATAERILDPILGARH